MRRAVKEDFFEETIFKLNFEVCKGVSNGKSRNSI